MVPQHDLRISSGRDGHDDPSHLYTSRSATCTTPVLRYLRLFDGKDTRVKEKLLYEVKLIGE